MSARILAALLLIVPIAAAGSSNGGEVRVAVAANFAPTLDRLARSFEESGSGHLRISSASTGKLYAQIVQGAPFDLQQQGRQPTPRIETEDAAAFRA